MKKLVLSLAVLATMVFWACSSDDDSPQDTDCVTCSRSADDSFQLCNRNGQAVLDGVNIGGSYEEHREGLENVGYTCE